MKKMLYFILFIHCSVFATQKEVCVVPVYQDHKTGQWHGLFIKSPQDKSWSMIKASCRDDQPEDRLAFGLFNHYINKQLAINFAHFNKNVCKQLHNDTTIFYVPVDYQPANNFKKMGEKKNVMSHMEFHWTNLKELSERKTLTKIIHGKVYSYPFDSYTQAIVKNVPMTGRYSLT